MVYQMAAILLKNRYRVLRELADGKFGQTFLAEDTQTPSGKKCIIKQLKPLYNHPQISQLVREKFQQEAAILETLGDNNSQVPRFYAYFVEAEEFYLVEEWIQGQTLTARIQQVGLCSERKVKEILLSILLVLQYIHSQGVIHRNINPNNIIWRSLDSKPVLINFGMVKETMAMTVTADGHVKSSIVVGALGFIPNEQAEGIPLFASDLYALGLTAIYLLTGKMPLEFKTNPITGEILWQQHASNVSPSFAAILNKTIHQSARERYMNAPAMLAALQQLDTNTIPVVPPPPQSPPPVSAPLKPQSSLPIPPTPTKQSISVTRSTRKAASWINFFQRLKGDNIKLPPKHSARAIIFAWLGGFVAISAVALLSNTFSVAFVLGSFGASCVLVFGFPDVPFSQPRNVLGGHLFSSLIGLVCLTLFGATWWSVAIAVSTAISVMMITRTTHPPAGSNPVIIYLTKPAWSFLLFPTVFGAIVLIFVALLYNNFTRESRYPKYW